MCNKSLMVYPLDINIRRYDKCNNEINMLSHCNGELKVDFVGKI